MYFKSCILSMYIIIRLDAHQYPNGPDIRLINENGRISYINRISGASLVSIIPFKIVNSRFL